MTFERLDPAACLESRQAVITDFCSRPDSIWLAIGSEGSVKTSTSAGATSKRPSRSPSPFGRITATGTSPSRTSACARARSTVNRAVSRAPARRARTTTRSALSRASAAASLPADLRLVLVDHRHRDPRRRVASLIAEHQREDREERDRQDERHRLGDPVATQADESDAQQRADHSRSSLPVRWRNTECRLGRRISITSIRPPELRPGRPSPAPCRSPPPCRGP